MKNKDLFFPEAEYWMWNYCTSLGQYIDDSNNKYDLGVYEDKENNFVSNATVTDNKPGSYISGDIYPKMMFDNELSREVLKRYNKYKERLNNKVMKTKYEVFIPEFYFDSRTETWKEINEHKGNWLKDSWKNEVSSIYQMLPELIVVIFNEMDSSGYNNITLYQGTLC